MPQGHLDRPLGVLQGIDGAVPLPSPGALARVTAAGDGQQREDTRRRAPGELRDGFRRGGERKAHARQGRPRGRRAQPPARTAGPAYARERRWR